MKAKKKVWENEWLWALAGGVALLACILFSGFRGLYGQDAYEYWRYAAALKHSFVSGESAGSFFWPVLYPLLGAVVSFLFQNAALALLIISVAAHCLTFVLVVKMIRQEWQTALQIEGMLPVVFAFVAVFLSPYLLRASALVMADSLSMCLITGSFYFSLRYLRLSNPLGLVLCCALASAALFTRYAAAVPVSVPVCIAFLHWLKQPKIVALAGAVGVSVIIALPHFILNHEKPAGFLGHAWLTNWSPLHFIGSSFQTPDGFSEYALPNVIHSFSVFFHPGFFVLFLPLLFFLRESDFRKVAPRLALACVLLYALFLSGIPYQNIRFLVLTLPLVALLFWPAFSRVAAMPFLSKAMPMMILVLVAVQVLLAGYVSRKIYPQWQLEQAVSEAVKQFPDRTIYSFSFEGTFQYFDVKQKQVSTFSQQIAQCEKGGLLLVQPGVAETQWKGMNPATNWQFFHSQCKLKLLQSFPNDWRLYEIQ